MEQKDYKAIAEIIENSSIKGVYTDRKIQAINKPLFILRLADYFVKEDEETLIGFQKRNLKFNKKQFLKDCGVEE